MMNATDRGEDERTIVAVLPACAQEPVRLRMLAAVEPLPVVAAAGQYNHGQRLLAELS